MEIRRIYTTYAIIFLGVILLAGCSRDPRSTHIEYAPQMYHSLPLEPFSQYDFQNAQYDDYGGKFSFYAKFKDSVNAQIPPEGTVAVNGWDTYPYADTKEGKEAAKVELKNPLADSDKVRAEGKVLFERFCAVCHGKKGKSDGPVITKTNGAYPPPPSYDSKTGADITQGIIFHILTYGQNTMGSYASQLTPTERWKVARYVATMQKPMAAATPPADANAEAGDQPDNQ